MKCRNVYESDSMRTILGQTLRPGGFNLTEKGVEFCSFLPGDPVLDLGCGRGGTVNYLISRFNLKAVGIDLSEKLIKEAREQFHNVEFFHGSSEKLPFPDESFHGIFAECTLSLMDNLDKVIKEVSRVLKKKGWFIITDVYARNPENISSLEKHSINSCMRGLHDLEFLKEKLKKMGFKIELVEDCSHYLRELLVKIVFSCGSMGAFWNFTTENCIDVCNFQKELKLCKPGYFIMIIRKGETNHV